MNRYILFGWAQHEAKGGHNDILGIFNDEKSALNYFEENAILNEYGCYHFRCLETDTAEYYLSRASIYSTEESKVVMHWDKFNGWENMND